MSKTVKVDYEYHKRVGFHKNIGSALYNKINEVLFSAVPEGEELKGIVTNNMNIFFADMSDEEIINCLVLSFDLEELSKNLGKAAMLEILKREIEEVQFTDVTQRLI